MVRRDVLDDREAQAGAAGGARAGAVHAEEPLEDPLQLVLRDADALILHGDLDHPVLMAHRDADPRARLRVGDRVRDQVGQGSDQHRGGAVDTQPAAPADAHLDLRAEGEVAVQRHGLLDHLVDLDRLGIGEGGAALDARELDDLLHQMGEAPGLRLHPLGEAAHRIGVLGRVLHGLGQQGDRADGGLQLMGHVGDEVTPGLLDPDRAGEVVGHQQRAVLAERADAHVDHRVGVLLRGAAQGQALVAESAVAADVGGELHQLRVRQTRVVALRGADDPVGVGQG